MRNPHHLIRQHCQKWKIRQRKKCHRQLRWSQYPQKRGRTPPFCCLTVDVASPLVSAGNRKPTGISNGRRSSFDRNFAAHPGFAGAGRRQSNVATGGSSAVSTVHRNNPTSATLSPSSGKEGGPTRAISAGAEAFPASNSYTATIPTVAALSVPVPAATRTPREQVNWLPAFIGGSPGCLY